MEEHLCLLLDSGNTLLAQGRVESSLTGSNVQIEVLGGKVKGVVEHEIVQVIGMGNRDVPLQCHIQRQRGDRVVLEVISVLDPELRRNLRIPVRFHSFLYPGKDSRWRGQRPIRSIDLSCGGLAFYAQPGLLDREKMEVVIPVTTYPLVMQIQILKQRQLRSGLCFYASKFVNMCNDEEYAIRKAVFSIQIQNQAQANNDELEEEL